MSNTIWKKLFEEITYFGGIFFFAFIVILLIAIGNIQASLTLFIGLLIIYFLTFIIRLFYFKARPSRQDYANFIEKLDASSFPSVHAARVTLLAFFSIFAVIYKPQFVLFPVYAIMIAAIWLLTCYSRIYLKKHYLTDVLAGILLGILSSLIFLVH